jgi:hypothetical protein
MAKNVNNIIYKVQVDATSGKISIDGVTKSFEQADKAFLKLQKDVAKGIPNATKNVKNLGDATGSATSATMELSRVISDAPYGIRGMANNITQLVSQLGTASTKAGGLTGALKLMGKQLMGPLGIVFAITAAVSALDFFFGANKKAEKGVGDLTKKVYANGLVMRGYVKELEDVNISEERRAVVVQELIKGVPTLTEADLEYGNNLDDVRIKIKQYTLAQAARIEMDKLVEENSELLSKQMRIDAVNATENQEEKLKLIKGLLEEEGIELEKLVNKSYSMGQKSLTLRKKTNAELISEFKDLAKGVKKESDPILERIERISQGLALDPAKSGSSKLKKAKRDRVKAFDTKQLQKDALSYVRQIQAVNEKIALLSTKDKASRLIIQRDFHMKRLLETNDANSELIRLWKKYYQDVIKVAEEANMTSEADLSFGERGGATAEQIKDRQRLLTQVKLEALMESSQAIGGFLDGEFQREITREQNKTNALNNELRERLNNENLSKSERKGIQLEIARNDEALRKKQEVIEKKRFKMQKAINVSQALLSTYLAVAQVQANPLDLNPVTKGISMAATLAVGLANVATLARQKFQSSAGATSTAGALGGGGSGGGNDRSFNFNLAGASQENQLAQTLQGRFNQPLQAYVVSRDITNQQQLDEEITSSASFG